MASSGKTALPAESGATGRCRPIFGSMWTHCTFCTGDLGRNEVIETFPIGRRLAFDAVKGRLWVVCKHCRGWNLTPLEERWEAVEDCERLFRLVRTRVSTGELGLARLSEGLELVRIGRPLRPEFATWRYGEQFERRHRRAMVGGAAIVGAGVVVTGGVIAGGLAIGVTTAPLVGGLFGYVTSRAFDATTLRGAQVRTADGRLRVVRGRRVERACLVRPEGRSPDESDWSLWVPFTEGWELVTGAEAGRITSRFIRQLNHDGGTRRCVREALNHIRLEGRPQDFLRTLLRERAVDPDPPERIVVGPWGGEVRQRSLVNWLGTRKAFAGSIGLLHPAERLAFEMVLNEERERRALEGELRLLEEAWREAEEIAAIADALLEPEGGIGPV